MSEGSTFDHSARHEPAIPGFPVLISMVTSLTRNMDKHLFEKSHLNFFMPTTVTFFLPFFFPSSFIFYYLFKILDTGMSREAPHRCICVFLFGCTYIRSCESDDGVPSNLKSPSLLPDTVVADEQALYKSKPPHKLFASSQQPTVPDTQQVSKGLINIYLVPSTFSYTHWHQYPIHDTI